MSNAAFGYDKLIQFRYQLSPESGQPICFEPQGRFSTCLDAGNERAAAVSTKGKEQIPFYLWAANHLPEIPNVSFSFAGATQNLVAHKVGLPSAAIRPEPITEKTEINANIADAQQLQAKLFSIVQWMLCGIITVLFNAFIFIFSSTFTDCKDRTKRFALWGYILSLDFGFVLLANQGLWMQNRTVSGPGCLLGSSSEIAILLLVAGAWFQCLRGSLPVKRAVELLSRP